MRALPPLNKAMVAEPMTLHAYVNASLLQPLPLTRDAFWRNGRRQHMRHIKSEPRTHRSGYNEYALRLDLLNEPGPKYLPQREKLPITMRKPYQ